MTEHNHDSNINESTIKQSPEDKQASDETHMPGEDLESAPGDDRLTPEKIGEAARKVATETAYVAAGFAGLVGEKAKAFYDEQKKQYTDAHPDEDAPSAKAFLDQLSEQLNRFADDLSRSYREMAERGRNVVQRSGQTRRAQDDGSAKDGETTAADDDADASADPSVNDGESDVAADTPTFSSNLAEDVSEKTPADNDGLMDPEKQDGIV